MNINKYEVFVKLAEKKNMTAVATEMNYSQGAVSYTIRSLEEEYQLEFFRRTSKGVLLTSYGEEMLPLFKELLSINERIKYKLSDINHFNIGELKIGSCSSVAMNVMPFVVKRFLTEYPNVQLVQKNGVYSEVLRAIEEDEIVLGFLSEQSSSNLNFIPLYEDEYCIVLPKDHKFANLERIPIELLYGENFIVMDEGGEFDSAKILDEIKDMHTIHYVQEDSMAIPLVEQGLGISILPELIVDRINADVVVKRFAVPRTRVMGLATKTFDTYSPLINLFINVVKEYVENWDNNHIRKLI